MDMQTLLNKKVSFQIKAWGQPETEITIEEALAEIKTGKYSSEIQTLRGLLFNNQDEDYSILKKKLPAVTFCGTFDMIRRKENIRNYNPLIVIDIDNIDEKEMDRVKTILFADTHILAFWESPSKRGIKGLIPIKYNYDFDISQVDSNHLHGFRCVKQKLQDEYCINLDASGSDTTRLCFQSADPHLTINTSAAPILIEQPINATGAFVIKIAHNTQSLGGNDRNRLFNPEGKNAANHRFQIESIIKYLKKANLSITQDYVDWVRVSYAIANSFTYDIGEKYFVRLSELDINKFNENECKELLAYCYQRAFKTSGFSTIVYLAQKRGFTIRSKKGKFLRGSQ